MPSVRDLAFDIRGRDRTQAAFDSAKRNARSFNDTLSRVDRGMALAGTAAKAFVAGFAIEGLQRFGSVVRGVIGDAADLVDLADRVGVSVEDIQRLQYGFQLAGVDAAGVANILEQWSKRIGEAHVEGGRLAEILKANGVSLTDADGKLRSSVDLMREFSGLVQHAGSDQERLVLIGEAFGRANAEAVNALRDGPAAFDKIMRASDRANGVVREGLMRTAAEVDDAFDQMWQSFTTESKRAILSAIDLMIQLRAHAADYEAARNAAVLGDQMGRMVGTPLPDRGDRLPTVADQRIDQAFRGPATPTDEAMARALNDRFGARTIIPSGGEDSGGGGGGGGSRRAAAGAAREQRDAYREVMDALEEERQAIRLSEAEQRVLTEQRRAGVEATSAQGQAIADKVRAVEAEIAAQQRLEEQQYALQDSVEYLQDAGFDAFWSFGEGAESASEKVRQLGMDMAKAAAYAVLFNRGPLAGLFGGGTGAGGLIGSLFNFGGGRAEGGPVDPWTVYNVGERGPEKVLIGGQGGRVMPAGEGGGGTSIVMGDTNIVIQGDANRGAQAQISQRLAEFKQDMLATMTAKLNNGRLRGT